MATLFPPNRIGRMRTNRPSIRVRMFAAGALTILAALGVAGLGLEYLFARHVERRAVAELQAGLQRLIAGLSFSADGAVTVAQGPGDPRFERLFGGDYWQVSQGTAPILRSRSLWDEAFDLPDDALAPQGYHAHVIPGPAGQELLVVERQISVARAGEENAFRVSMGVDRGGILQAVSDFRSDLVAALAALGLLLMAAFVLAIRFGLLPFEQVRAALMGLRVGRERRLAGEFPAEVQPLVEDLNALLDNRDASLERARGRAADLAHGLKTPLAAMTVLTDELRERGESNLASELSGYAAAMTGHVERELTRARLAEAQLTAGPVSLAGVVDPIIRTLQKLPRGGDLDWRSTLDASLAVRADSAALAEVMGNLLDNARKWARTTVVVDARVAGASVIVGVSDDGPGVPEADRAQALDRGKRLDAAAPGSGLGLSIAAEIVEQFDGGLRLDRAEGGGLLAEIRLPLAEAEV